MTITADIPEWVKENIDAGFSLGVHQEHLTSYEENVAEVTATGEAVHYCHLCEDFATDSEVEAYALTPPF